MNDIRRFFSFTAILYAAFALTASSVNAQLPPIPNVTVLPPILNNPSPYLTDWEGRASTATIIINNATGASIDCKIWVEFFLNGTLVAYSKPAKLPFRTIMPGVNSLNGEGLVPLSSVHFEGGVDQNSQRAGRIPDGQVCIVIHVLDPRTNRESVSINGCAIIFSYSPPQLILPSDGVELCRLGENNVVNKNNGSPMPMFQWTPIVPAAPQELQPIRYHFAIFEVLPGQSPIAAFRGARSVFETGNRSAIPDLIGSTNLLWPTQYFLPEKGKTYVWSVRALDSRNNPLVLTNDGWASPFTFTVPPNCDQSNGSGNPLDGLLITPQISDFGSVNLGTITEPHQIAIINIGNNTITIHPPKVSGVSENAGFAVSLQPSLYTLEPGVSTSFNVVFKPTKIGLADGSVMIATDNGSTQIPLKGQGMDPSAPTIQVINPQGGENLKPGSAFKIKFNASDNDALTNFVVNYSIDGGVSFSNVISSPITFGKPSDIIWNVPADLQTSQAIIKITAKDKSGNTIEAVSGVFSIGDATGDNENGRGNGLNNDPNLNQENGNANLYDPRTSYRFIPLGARFILSTSSGNMDYILPQFSVHVPAGHPWTVKDEQGNSHDLSIQIPEEMSFRAIHPPFEQTLSEFTGGSAKDATSPGGGMPHVKIQMLGANGGIEGSAIKAYFNPKEISIDKSVQWEPQKRSEGDAPSLEFTAGDPKSLSCELMFDMFEEKKSVVPGVTLLHHISDLGGLCSISFGDLPPMKVKIDSPHARYTMFLADGTPCRATVQLRMTRVDSLPPRKQSSDGGSQSAKQNSEQGSYMSMWGNSASLPQNAEPLMTEPSSKQSEGILIGLLRNNKSKKGTMNGAQSNPMYEDRKMASWGYRYRVDYNGGTAFFKSVSGLESETEVVAYREGGVNESTHKIIGARKWPNIVLKQGFSEGESSRKFLAAAAVKTTTNRSGISITVYDNDGAPKQKYNFFECWPVKYKGPELNAKNNEVAIESLELSNEGVEIESMDEPIYNSYSGNFNTASGALSLLQKRMTFTVPTQFDGRPATILISGILELPSDPTAAAQEIKKLSGNTKAEVDAVLPGGDWNSHARNSGGDGSGTGSGSNSTDDKSYTAGHFELIIDGEPAGIIKKLEGGDIKADGVEEPGKPISVEIQPTGKVFWDWVQGSFSNNQRKSGELQAADFKRDVREVREFKDALVTEITIPACDGASKEGAYLKLMFTPEKTRTKKGSGKVDAPIDVKQKLFFGANFRMNVDGLEKACSKISKIDAITIKQTTTTDDIGNARDYQREPGKIDLPDISFTVSEEYSYDFQKWMDAFVIKGNNDDSKHKNGSLTYLDPTRSKELLTINFECIGIFKGTAEASENNSDKIRKVKYILRLRKIILK